MNTDMHDSASVNDQLSGTTAICTLLKGTKMYVSCAGDSRAVLGCGEWGWVLSGAGLGAEWLRLLSEWDWFECGCVSGAGLQ